MATKTINNALSELLSQYEIDKQVGIESKFLAQYIISTINTLSVLRDKFIDKQEKKTSSIKKDELFEKCWIAYRRKGKKGKAKPYWNKLKEDERGRVLQHIKAYVSSRDVNYQQDFERYLRDKTFESIVFRGNDIVYDPTLGTDVDYHPFGNNSIMWNDLYKCWLSIDDFDGSVIDGYNDENRPDGAEIVLHNARGTITWSKKDKKWNVEMKTPWK